MNTTDSRVEVSLDLTTTTALDAQQRDRAVGRLGERLVVSASEHRSQHRNRVAARHGWRAGCASPWPLRR